MKNFSALCWLLTLSLLCGTATDPGLPAEVCIRGECVNGSGTKEITLLNIDSQPERIVQEGTFVNGRLSGRGTERTFVSEKLKYEYEGIFVTGKAEGKGQLRSFRITDGGIDTDYVGDFRSGLMSGQGQQYTHLPDGRRAIAYNGSWLRGLRHGYGIEYYPFDGTITRKGIWENGEFIREEKRPAP